MPRRTSYSVLRPELARIFIRVLEEELYPSYDPARLAFVLQGKVGEDLLASALALPRQSYYKGTLRKAAVLLRSLVNNHPFIDGNKRFALFMVTLFLATNKFVLLSPKDEAVTFLLRVAGEDKLSIFSIERWLNRFCLYGVPMSNALQKFKRMATKYPGGLPVLESTINVYKRTILFYFATKDKI